MTCLNEWNERFKEGVRRLTNVATKEFLADIDNVFDRGRFKAHPRFRLEGEAAATWMIEFFDDNHQPITVVINNSLGLSMDIYNLNSENQQI